MFSRASFTMTVVFFSTGRCGFLGTGSKLDRLGLWEHVGLLLLFADAGPICTVIGACEDTMGGVVERKACSGTGSRFMTFALRAACRHVFLGLVNTGIEHSSGQGDSSARPSCLFCWVERGRTTGGSS